MNLTIRPPLLLFTTTYNLAVNNMYNTGGSDRVVVGMPRCQVANGNDWPGFFATALFPSYYRQRGDIKAGAPPQPRAARVSALSLGP